MVSLLLFVRSFIGSLSKDDGYGYDKATKQEYYWLKKEKYSCCTCSTNFRAFLRRTPQNNDVTSPNFRFWRQREHITMNHSWFSIFTLKPFVPFSYRIVHPYCTRWKRRNNRQLLAIVISYILEWRFRWLCRCLCLTSLVTPSLSWLQAVSLLLISAKRGIVRDTRM